MFLKILTVLKQIILVLFFSFLLSLIFDFVFGKRIMNLLDPYISKTEFYDRILRVKHPIYHHDLKPNIKFLHARGFNGNYTLCTDNHGFKSECDEKRGKEFKYAFIGDSFTEALGMNYKNSFSGIFENYTKKSLANLGVTSYSTKIYLSKLNYLINKNYKFEHVVIFVDISDLHDDSTNYTLDKNFNVGDKKKISNKLSKKIINYYKEITPFHQDNFPLTNFYLFVLKNLKHLKNNEVELEPLNNNFSFTKKSNLRAKWTYSGNTIDGYNGNIHEAQNDMLNNMNQLYEILKKNNIKMSIGVYPWPHQLIFDTRNSKHVTMWRNFCKNKCTKFINTFDVFFDEIEKTDLDSVIKKYYFKNDPHFNELGNKLIFDQLIKYLN